MEKGKHMIGKVTYYLKKNIIMEKDGMEKDMMQMVMSFMN